MFSVAWLYLIGLIISAELSYLFKKTLLLRVACALPLKKMLALKFGIKKLNAYFLLVSGTNALCDGFSKASYKVPVFNKENCCAKILTEKNSNSKTSKNFFI